ncbi:dermokine isoform X7 [Nycticebus coucang]|uniref:dermokine isoform X7 n=1 Tax=Nycticebus coucang TaxID=9470 RepID=UPI00234C2AC0|nr:dermokine isoform X7 [Nycticebus coucang]
MKLLSSLPCLLLALCLGSGKAGPLQGGAGINVGEAVGHGVGDALSQGLGQALGHEGGGAARDAAGQGFREAAGSAAREATDALGHKIGEAAHGLGNGGSEAARQVGNALQHGADAAHGSWQGMPGGHGAWGASGGHGGGVGDIGNLGGSGTPWGHGFPGSSSGSFGTQGSFGGPGGNGVPPNTGANVQGAVAQPGYDSMRGSGQNTGCTNPPPSGSGGSSSNSGGSSGSQSGSSGSQSGSSGSQSGSNSGRGDDSYSSSGTNWDQPLENSNYFDQSSHPSSQQGSNTGSSSSGSSSGNGSGNKPECDNPGNAVRLSGGSGDQNFKSKLGFINWDAIDKNKVPAPSTRARLYFHRLWEEFKSNTPFFNWKAITEGADPSLQKRAGGADQFSQPGGERQDAAVSKNHVYGQQAYPTAYSWQYPPKTPAKGGVTPSSSASRVQPSLLHWMKFW